MKIEGSGIMSKINFFKVVPKGMDNLLNMESYFKDSTLDSILIELIKIRSSQINKCDYCLNMHTIDAVRIGETSQRIYLLNAGQETSLFTEKEKIVLELTEKVTNISSNIITEEFRNNVLTYFTEKEFAEIVLMICQINTWNRINVTVGNDIDINYK